MYTVKQFPMSCCFLFIFRGAGFNYFVTISWFGLFVYFQLFHEITTILLKSALKYTNINVL